MTINTTTKYLNSRHNQLDAVKKDLFENMNPANFDDMIAYKRMSTEVNVVRNIMKSEFELDHKTKKRILDSFQ